MGNPYAPPGEHARPPEGSPRPGDDPGPGSGDAPADAPHGAPPQWPGPEGSRPGAGPGRRRPQPAPDSPIARTTSRRVLRFLTLLLAAVVTSGLPLPWQLGAVGFLAVAVGVAVHALVHALRGGIRGGIVVMLGVGVVVSAFVGLAMLSWLALWPQHVQHQECLARAVTISATRQCEVEFDRAVDERLGTVQGTGTSGA